jgi:carbamoyl-phosphate synthase large subunit
MINILVTAIGSGGLGEQTLKALELATHSNYNLFGTEVTEKCKNSELVTEFMVLPYASDNSYLSHLIELCLRYNIDVLIPGSEIELSLISRNRVLFNEIGVFLAINSYSVIDTCMDKLATNSLLKKLGFSVPRYETVSTYEHIETIDFYPVVVKPQFGGKGSSDVYIAQSITELKGLAMYLDLTKHDRNFLIQEYIGTPADEYTVGILHSSSGELIDSIALNRDLSRGLSVRSSTINISGNDTLGEKLVISSGISQGTIGKYAEVCHQCEDIASKLHSCGPLNIQCRFHDGKVWVFEINPRFSGTSSLRALVGFNEADLFIQNHILGINVSELKSQCSDFHYIERLLVEYIHIDQDL